MYISEVMVRFFKSFNYDFLRKHHPEAEPHPWETIDDAWFPFVRVPLMEDITTVVGANESGKSHLLAAIKKGLSGNDIVRRDFCRYSQFFTVEEGKMRWPDFGFRFQGVSDTERAQLVDATGIEHAGSFDSFTMIRTNRDTIELWIHGGESPRRFPVENPDKLLESKLLPKVFHINSSVALPGSVPLSWLQGKSAHRWSRAHRRDVLSAVDSLSDSLGTAEGIKNGSSKIVSKFQNLLGSSRISDTGMFDNEEARERAFQLAKDLVFKVAKIDKTAIKDLSDAIAREDEGLANGILQQINQRLATALNFPKWWVQDRDFRLSVSARDDDLVFTISDRTQTEYAFGERSNGLRYFLSYYIQYLAHESEGDQREILLMDEPDAYLSSQGQQDLLKIFNSFAHPEEGRNPVQVVYVTHSPFLIDRNHGERIRVLEKGADDEGTRVVNDASKNHYEPLRSSFGAYVAETAFIGNCNLMVEGLADQVLLAGSSTYLRATGTPKMKTLDLNRITVVPAGSASHIPYLVYLARGRDVEQPSVVVLLDSDQAGKDAKKGLRRGGAKGKQVINPSYILMIGDLEGLALPDGKTPVETEDLIPPGIAAAAARSYLMAVCHVTEDTVSGINAELIQAEWTKQDTLFDSVCACVREVLGEEYHVDKVGFARSVVELVQSADRVRALVLDDVQRLKTNFEVLLARLAQLQRNAERDTARERISRRVDRSIKAFLRDHTTTSEREDAILLLEEVEGVLDDSMEADQVHQCLMTIRREHDLAEPKPGTISDFERFQNDLLSIRYTAVNAIQEPDPVGVQLSEPKAVPEHLKSKAPPESASVTAT